MSAAVAGSMAASMPPEMNEPEADGEATWESRESSMKVGDEDDAAWPAMEIS